MVPKTWIVDCLKIYKISDKIIKLITETMKFDWAAEGKTFSKVENPKRHHPRRCAFAITICNSNDATQLHTKELHWGLQFYKVIRKINHIYVHGRHEAFKDFKK